MILSKMFPSYAYTDTVAMLNKLNTLLKVFSARRKMWYIPGEAVILEGMVGMAENNAILQTLQTKWKNISVDWDGGVKPSIN